jgi:GIY-YIG catalytic domain
MNIINILQIDDPTEYKVHFASAPKDKKEPLYAFWKGSFQTWQNWQTQKNFERRYILSLIFFDNGEWLFAGIYESLGCEKHEDHYEYTTKLIDINNDLIGRLIIKYNKNYRQSYVRLEGYIESLEVSEILKFPSSFEKFPGYANVKVNFAFLKAIIQKNEATWKTALENMKGIYLITDQSNGKMYVGSAYGENMLWSRWQNYVISGHGGNVGLIEIIQTKGVKYAEENFQLTLLEAMKFNTNDEDVLKRETFWKEALKSKEFGYNNN